MKGRSRRTPTRSPTRCARLWPEALALGALLALPGSAAGQETDPTESAIRWTGAPAPVDGRTVGGALSPHGSHVGVKAILDPGDGFSTGSVGSIALLDGRASRKGRLAATSLVVEIAGEVVEPDDPSVTFEPWGWTSSSTVAEVQVRARTFFVAEDAIVLTLRLASSTAVDIVARLDVDANGAASADGRDVLVPAGDATLALGSSGDLAIRSGGPPALLEIGAASIPAGEDVSFTVMIGFGATADEARRARDGGWAAFASRDPDAAWDEQATLFDDANAAAECSDVEGDVAAAAHRLAVAALLSSPYAPRGALTRTLLSAAKTDDNAFLGSDLPAQARAIASWDPELALDALLGQIDALADDSHVPYRFDDQLVREPLPNGSMPPVQAQALAGILRWGADLDLGERGRVVRRLSAVAAWWPTNRDYRHAGLLVHGSPEEAGRPGSRRWPIVDGTSEAPYFEAPDLSVTYVEFLEALADLAEGTPDADPETWRSRARDLSERIEDDLWDDDLGQYVDRDTRSGELSRTTGPHGLAPLAAGTVRDEERVHRVLDGLLLREDGLWGDEDGPRPPVPSIAYDVEGVEPAQRPAYLDDVAVALRALSRYGRTTEAANLEKRVLALLASRPEGLYDRYVEEDADASGVMQAGGAAATVLSILHRDHERDRTILPGESSIEGRIAIARFLDGGARLVDLGGRARLPRLIVSAIEQGGALEDHGSLRVALGATCDVAVGDEVTVALPALGPFQWSAEDGSASGRSTGAFLAVVGRSYRIDPLSLRGGGCACGVGGRSDGDGVVLLAFALLAILTRARVRSR